ncbi:hypothetical protein [Halovibrio sp. HP20-50]|jgi:ABC-type lipoprotein release transport system permease subunit|uniref:hypothetical protein n=1 Tax=Halovibrio sp. HP20-59 TaxID=3080275 RepID=UPI00294AD124|nr:hypothetical protein [Halovibrio sp. HP20-59]MEA2118784.1 hypothetical protein [Halovibrio sp. HP20-59]
MIGTVVRGVRNPFRSGARAALIVALLALLLGASHSELIVQVVAAVGAHFTESLFGRAFPLGAQLLPMFLFAAALALIGSVYPVIRILGLSPAVAFKETI